METLNIGLVQPELWLPRGGEKHFCKLAYWLGQKGHEVTLYTLRKNHNDYPFDWLIRDCEVIELSEQAFTRPLFLDMPRLLWLSGRLAKKMKKHDILNGHNFPSEWVCGKSKMPSVWLCNDPPVFADGQHKWVLDPYYKIIQQIDCNLTKDLRYIACLSNLVKKELETVYPDKELVMVGAGAELDRKVDHVENDKTDIIYIAPLIEHKRPMDIIGAVAKIKDKYTDIVVHLVGEGELRKKIIEEAQKQGINVKLYGKVNDDKLYEVYSIADIAVHASDLEPWGIFALEAILAGIPTVVTDQIGSAEVLKNVPLYKCKDIDALAYLIGDIIENKNKHRKIVEGNRRIVASEYSWEAHAERMLDLYKKEISRHNEE